MSTSSSRISTNWPEVTFSTNFGGNGLAVSKRVSPLPGGWMDDEVLVDPGAGGSGVALVTAGGSGGVQVVRPDVGGVTPVSGTEPNRCGGGRVPSNAKIR